MDRNVALDVAMVPAEQSLSARRAWIEMTTVNRAIHGLRSLSARRAWIEIDLCGLIVKAERSLSARRAWIEIR